EAARAARTRKQLARAREAAEQWRGAAELHHALPGLPDHAPVRGADVKNLLNDLNDALLAAGTKIFDTEDKKFLAGLGVPADEGDAPWAGDGWTAGAVRRAAQEVAAEFKTDADRLLAKARRERGRWQRDADEEVRQLEEEAGQLEAGVRVLESR